MNDDLRFTIYDLRNTIDELRKVNGELRVEIDELHTVNRNNTLRTLQNIAQEPPIANTTNPITNLFRN